MRAHLRMMFITVLLVMMNMAIPRENVFSLVTLTGPGTVADHAARSFSPWLANSLGRDVTVLNLPLGVNIDNMPVFHDEAKQCQSLFLLSSSTYYGLLEQGARGAKVSEQFMPVYGSVAQAAMVVVDGKTKWRSLTDLVHDLKEHPSLLGVPGPQLKTAGGQIHQRWQLDVDIQRYSSEEEMAAGIKSGSVDFALTFATSKQMREDIAAGRIRVLSVLSDQRSRDYPHVKTHTEQGVDLPAIHFWTALFVTKNQGEHCAQRMTQVVGQTLQQQSWGVPGASQQNLHLLQLGQMQDYIRQQTKQLSSI